MTRIELERALRTLAEELVQDPDGLAQCTAAVLYGYVGAVMVHREIAFMDHVVPFLQSEVANLEASVKVKYDPHH